MDEIKQRKGKILRSIKQNYIIYLLLIFVIWVGAFLRTRNLIFLQKKYLIGSDPYIVLRYVNYIVEHGKLFAIDKLRYYPFGYSTSGDIGLLSTIIAKMYNFFHIFKPSMTSSEFVIIYPVIMFILSMVVFFFLIKLLFNDKKIALISTAFLAVMPAFLYRTMAGFSEKEPIGILLMFLVIYTFIAAFKSNNKKKYLTLIILSGLLTSLTAYLWGAMSFMVITISIFILISYLFNNLNKKNIYLYLIWALFYIMILFLKNGFFATIDILMASPDAALLTITFIILLMELFSETKYLSNIKKKINQYLPYKLVFIFIIIIVGILGILLFFNPADKIQLFKDAIFSPMTAGIFEKTIMESRKAFIKEDILQGIGNILFLSLISSVYLFYKLINKFKNYKRLLIVYILFLLGFTFDSYSNTSILNGTSFISKFIFLSSILLLFISLAITYFKLYYKDKNFTNYRFNGSILFVLVWFLISFSTAKAALRFMFTFSPIVLFMSVYFLIQLAKIDYKKLFLKKENNQKTENEDYIKEENKDFFGSINVGEQLK